MFNVMGFQTLVACLSISEIAPWFLSQKWYMSPSLLVTSVTCDLVNINHFVTLIPHHSSLVQLTGKRGVIAVSACL